MSTANLSNVFHLGRNNEFKRWLLILFKILLDFLLIVKAATLIFISGRGSAISSAKEGKSGFIYTCQPFDKELISF